jgi:uncharacterized protein DUF2721
MQSASVAQWIMVLQTAIGPVILISGVGLLLLTMTNRFGRTIDRARLLSAELANAGAEHRIKIITQLHVLWKRARLVRLSILLASISALAAALLVIVLFLVAGWGFQIGWLIGALFSVCMATLIGSLSIFLHDINLGLAALKLELRAEGISER